MIHIFHSAGESEIVWDGKPVSVLQLLRDNNIFIDSPCSGRGKCGKCRIVGRGDLSEPAERERVHLSASDLSSGVRLACSTIITGADAEIRVPRQQKMEIVTEGTGETKALNPFGKELGLAVDIGTTTVAAYLYDLKTGTRLGSAVAKNPQSTFGADVVSRQEYSIKGGGDELARVIRSCIAELSDELTGSAGRKISDIDSAVITGNTTMLYLLCAYDVEDIALYPFTSKHMFGEFFKAADFFSGFSPDCQLYLPPCISAYVGADITCAILSSGMLSTGENTLLADIGTNGELALSAGDRLLCCATAAGPAFEGAGIELGSNALPGAVDRVWADGNNISIHTIGNAAPKTICGSGLLDALAVFIRLGIVDETGRLESTNGAPVYLSDSSVYISQSDVRNIQLAKAAIRGGIETLLFRADLTGKTAPALLIAGGFGSKLNPESAARIGMIPENMLKRSLAIGNAAGLGAVNILLDKNNIEECRCIAEKASLLELSTDPKFSENFMEQIAFEV